MIAAWQREGAGSALGPDPAGPIEDGAGVLYWPQGREPFIADRPVKDR